MRRRLRIAHHEAGHAVAAVKTNTTVKGLSVIQTTDSLGRVECHWDFAADQTLTRTQQARELAERSIIIAVSGIIAEQMFSGRFNWLGSTRDLAAAQGYVAGSARTKDERQAYFESLWVRSRDLLRLHWPAVASLARRLAEDGEIAGPEARKLIGRAAIDDGEVRLERDVPVDRKRLSHWLRAARTRAG
jgi:hypothetical protein